MPFDVSKQLEAIKRLEEEKRRGEEEEPKPYSKDKNAPSKDDKTLDMIEKRLKDKPWLGGDKPSQLDVNRFKSLKSKPTEAKHKKAFDWYKRMSKKS